MSLGFDPSAVHIASGWTPDEWSIGFNDPREGESRTHMIVVIPDETGWDGAFFQLRPRPAGSRLDVVEWAVQAGKDVYFSRELDEGYRDPVDGERLANVLGFSVTAAIALPVFKQWRLTGAEYDVDGVFEFAGLDFEGNDASVEIRMPASGWEEGRISVRQEYGIIPLDVLAWILIVVRHLHNGAL